VKGRPVPPLLAPAPQGPVEPGPVPSFSILIAAYQAASFIGDAIESALAQTVSAHEIIVCDDGSTDDLETALAPYRDRLTVVRQENRGPGAAKNAAAREASGDYLVILDADDAYLPTRLAALGVAAAARPDLDILVTDAFVEVDGRVVRHAYDGTWAFAVDDQRGAILDRCFILGHAAVKRERFIAVGGFAGRRAVDDWDLWMRAIFAGSRAGLIPEPLSRYRVRAGSVSTDRRAILEGGIHSLERMAARDDLTGDERRILEFSLGRRRRELTLVEAQDALRAGRPDVRRRLAGIAVGHGYGLRARLKAVGSAVFPWCAAAELRRRERGSWVGAAGVRVERDDTPADLPP
jgi:glycosyltransferase involved in cell wall biosynthesis